MVGEDDVSADYEASLSELTFNSKPHINMLTMLAEENVQFASKIVEVIESHLHKVSSNQMLPTLYLIDSIAKNLPNSSYRELFNKNLVKNFVHVFEKVDEKTRASMYKLRETWNGYFAPSKLYGIDIKVHAVDRAWPVQYPDRSAAASSSSSNSPAVGSPSTAGNSSGVVATSKSIHVNPDFILKGTKTKSNTDGRVSASSNVGLEVKQKELLQRLEEKKLELNRLTQQAGRTESRGQLQSVVTIPPPSQHQRDPRLARGGSQHRPSVPSSGSHRSERGNNRSGSVEINEQRHQQQQQRLQDVDLRPWNNAQPSLPPKKRKPHSPATSFDSDPGTSMGKEKRKRTEQEIKQESPYPFGVAQDQDLRPMFRPQPPSIRVKEEPMEDIVEPVIPHRPIQKSPSAEVHDPTPPTPAPLMDVRISIDAPEISDNSLGSLMAYRDTILQRTEQQLTEGQITRQQYNDILCDFNCAMDIAHSSGNRAKGATGQRQPQNRPLMSASSSAPNFGRDRSEVDPIPANNLIFVDGRSYEVRYIDDVAVIERNGLPHRIYFVGTPRDVVIDGFAHTLAFGESKTITIDGHSHVIRYGAPSRELYMGPFPFRGSFGGPPIRATINGISHKIQLCGPPPEVKVDPEPAYELLRYVKESHMARAGPQFDQHAQHRRPVLVPTGPLPTPAPAPQLPPVAGIYTQQQPRYTPLPGTAPVEVPQQRPILPVQPGDVMNLYSKLVNSGIIVHNTQQQEQAAMRSATPPIPSKVRFGDGDVLERKNAEPDLRDFAPAAMKIRYVSVIEALYKRKTQCTICAMRFPDNDRQKYSKHLDWHFQQSRRDKDKASVRPWYLLAEDWIRHEELVDSNAPKAKSAVFESSQKKRKQSDEPGRVLVVSTDSVIPATDDNQECSVCGEKFEQFWDEDEEGWKMRNATLIQGMAYHPLCYQDVRTTDSVEPEASSSFAPLPDDIMASNSSGDESKNPD